MGKNYISMSKNIYENMLKLKNFNYESIYSKAITKEEKELLRQKFERLFDVYYNDLLSENKSSMIWKDFLSNMDENYLKNNVTGQIVIDYISGMTDNYFDKEYLKYFK